MLGKRLAESRKRLGWTQSELARELGNRYDQPMISRIESGRAGLQIDGLVEFSRVLNVSLDYLAGLTDVPDPVQSLTAVSASGFQMVVASHQSETAEPRSRGDSEAALGHLFFIGDWLTRHRVDPSKCSLIEILDKAMEPTLGIGELVLLDHSRTRRTQGRIYAVRAGNQLLVRRLTRSGQDWSLTSDSYEYPDIACPAEATILGRAVWASRML